MISLDATQGQVGGTEWDAVGLYEAYLEDVHAYASRRLPTAEDAEDATAETFGAAFSTLHKMRGRDPRVWLLGIARRKVADVYRQRSRRREIPLESDLAAETRLAHEHDEIAEIRRIVLGLPPDQREALLLQHLEELTIPKIAAVMGRSPAAVNSLLQRARARAYRAGKQFFTEEVNQ